MGMVCHTFGRIAQSFQLVGRLINRWQSATDQHCDSHMTLSVSSIPLLVMSTPKSKNTGGLVVFTIHGIWKPGSLVDVRIHEYKITMNVKNLKIPMTPLSPFCVCHL